VHNSYDYTDKIQLSFELLRGVAGDEPQSFWLYPKRLSRVTAGGSVPTPLEGTRHPIYCVHSAEDSNDEERIGSVPKMTDDLMSSEKHKYCSFSVIRLRSGIGIFQPPQLFFENSNSDSTV